MCVRTNISAKSVFVFSVRNIIIFCKFYLVYSFIMNKICSGQTLRTDWTYLPWKIRIRSSVRTGLNESVEYEEGWVLIFSLSLLPVVTPLSLPPMRGAVAPMRGAVVGRASTILQNDSLFSQNLQFCLISNFVGH